MSYIFPRRRLRAGDILDPIELTQDLSPAAERISGHLNAHNFNANIASTLTIEPEAVTDTWGYKLAVPFGDTHTATALEPWTGLPDETVPADAYLIQNTFEWQPIAESGGATAQVTLNTGSAVLWVHTFVQYLWYGFQYRLDNEPGYEVNYGHYSLADIRAANIQFAIRLDGSVVEDTVTGIDEAIYRASLPVKPVQQRNTTGGIGTPLPGSQDVRSAQICAIGPASGGPRISACLPVQAGEHTVEIVVRRVPLYLPQTGDTVPDEMADYTSLDKIYIMSRQVLITELKTFPVDSVVSTDISVPAFEEEDPVSNTTMYVERLQPLVAAYNDVAEGNLQRGALMHYHLPPVLRAQDTTRAELTTVFPGELYNCVYPGFNSAVIASAKYDAATPKVGWFMITDGTQDIEVASISIALKQRVVILANLQIINIDGGELNVGGTNLVPYCGGFAVFRLMWRISGTGDAAWQPLQESTAMVNSYIERFFNSNTVGGEFAEVMLMAEFSIGPLAATTIDVAAFGAVMNGNDPDLAPNQQKTKFWVKRGSILTLSLRD